MRAIGGEGAGEEVFVGVPNEDLPSDGGVDSVPQTDGGRRPLSYNVHRIPKHTK